MTDLESIRAAYQGPQPSDGFPERKARRGWRRRALARRRFSPGPVNARWSLRTVARDWSW